MRTRRTAVPKLQQCAASADGNGNNIYYILYSVRSPSLALSIPLAYTALAARRRDEGARPSLVIVVAATAVAPGWLVLARRPCLFVNGLENWFHVGTYTHFYLSPGALLLFLYA